VSAVEHAGILALTRHLAGVQVDRLPVTSDGALDLDAAADLMADDVALVSVMAANNETGVLMPVAQLAELARARGALLHVDATQLVGKLPFSFAASGADLATVSAHKLHGPKGVGALLVRPGLALPALTAGSQERGRRGGTENLPAIAGFAAAAALLPDADALAARAARLASLRDGLERDLGAAPARHPRLCARRPAPAQHVVSPFRPAPRGPGAEPPGARRRDRLLRLRVCLRRLRAVPRAHRHGGPAPGSPVRRAPCRCPWTRTAPWWMPCATR